MRRRTSIFAIRLECDKSSGGGERLRGASTYAICLDECDGDGGREGRGERWLSTMQKHGKKEREWMGWVWSEVETMIRCVICDFICDGDIYVVRYVIVTFCFVTYKLCSM